jgi:hypothetical protein
MLCAVSPLKAVLSAMTTEINAMEENRELAERVELLISSALQCTKQLLEKTTSI